MKKMYKLFVVVLTFTCMSFSLQAQLTIVNGGWEDGLASQTNARLGWVYDNNDGANTTYEIVTDDVKEGSNALKVTTTALGTNDWSSQIYNRSWDVQANHAYRLSMWFKDLSAGTDTAKFSFTMGYYISNPSDDYPEMGRLDHTYASKEDWQQKVLYAKANFTSNGTDTLVSMSNHFVGIGTILVDNFEVYEAVSDVAVSEDGSTVTLTFADEMAEPNAQVADAFIVITGPGDEDYILVTDAALDEADATKLVLTLEEPITSSDGLSIDFTSGPLTTVNNDVMASFTLPLNFEGGSGLIDNEYTVINVFPNPSKGRIYIENSYSISSVQFIDVTGKIVKTVKGNHITSIDVTDLSSGLYFMLMNSGSGKPFSGRIIVE